MDQTINPHVTGYVYNINELKEFMDTQGAQAGDKFIHKMPPSDFLDQTMHLFGVVAGDHFFLIDNLYEPDYTPLSAYIEAFREYYEDTRIGHLLTEAPSQEVPGTKEVSAEEWNQSDIEIPAQDD